MSAVTSATALLLEPNWSVFRTWKEVVLVGATSFLFFSGSILSRSRLDKAARSAFTSSVTLSATGLKAFVPLSTATQPFLTATPLPSLPASPRASSMAAFVDEPFSLTNSKTCTSGLPFSKYDWASGVSFHPSRFVAVDVVHPSASSDLMTPTSLSWSQPFFPASSTESGISLLASKIEMTSSFVGAAIAAGRPDASGARLC
mmetsp:Transcript_5612/g.15752  ORF Transcript_5612/g.15752 Transcript_5612/m.15752 type:complete len:202 (+) Transcript_5612:1122-1727(+)